MYFFFWVKRNIRSPLKKRGRKVFSLRLDRVKKKKKTKPVDTKRRPDRETYKNATNSHVARERDIAKE